MQPELAFSILMEGGDYWNFLAPDARTFSMWTEALTFLCSPHDMNGWLDAAPSVTGSLSSAAAAVGAGGANGAEQVASAADVRHDLQAMLELEMQLRLLDLDGVPLPETAYTEPPSVPPDPDDLAFAPSFESSF